MIPLVESFSFVKIKIQNAEMKNYETYSTVSAVECWL